ncbi:MAG: c-type cytochrome, partial [Anaeromyxobacteraceae bacterium]
TATVSRQGLPWLLALLVPLVGCAGPGAGAGANAAPGSAGGATVAETGGAGGGKKLNKYTGNAAAIQEGRTLYLQNGCSGCHGVGGGGGMAPPIVDDVWRFGSDDQTLFKLIKGQIPEQTMPKVYNALPDDEVWKILAFVRSQYAGDPQKADW